MTRTFVRLRRIAVLSVVGTLVAASVALAQTQEPTFQTRATTQAAVGGVPIYASQSLGKTVWMTTTDGGRFRARVTSVSPAGLVVVGDGAPMTIPYINVLRVEKSSHRLKNGTLIGLVAGVGVGVLSVSALCGWEDCEEGVFFLPIFTGIGAAAGLGVGAIANAAKKNSDVLYNAPRSTATMSLVPILSPTRKGLAFSMTWR